MKAKIVCLFFLLLILFLNCDNFMSGMPVNQFYSQSYMSLNVGDVRQIITVSDSSTLLWTVFGKTLRSDGVSVFCMEWKSGTSSRDTSYYLIREGYFLGTDLVTTNRRDINLRVNPFNEQRLAKLYPSDGEIFVHTPGARDSIYWVSRREEDIKTFCGVFEDVYSFSLFEDVELTRQILKTYYASGVGYVGTAGPYSSELDFMVSYVKVANIRIGSLWPEKDFVGDYERVEKKELYKFLINGYQLNTKNIVFDKKSNVLGGQ